MVFENRRLHTGLVRGQFLKVVSRTTVFTQVGHANDKRALFSEFWNDPQYGPNHLVDRRLWLKKKIAM